MAEPGNPSGSHDSLESRAVRSTSATVVVPTYKRPLDLKRCVEAIASQVWMPDEVIVVVRDVDAPTWEMVDQLRANVLPSVRAVSVDVSGQVQALNAGVAAATSDIIAITDDDAAPHADWLDIIVKHFDRDPSLGGVGGRDLMRVNGVLQQGHRPVVGRVPLVGPTIGNHHVGYGLPRRVDVLKGVNCAYRAAPLREIGFDRRLRGKGAQVHNEIALGIAMRRRGWGLLYDPSVIVDHYTSPRFDEDQRHAFNALATSNAVFNETMVRLEFMSTPARIALLAWGVLIGTRGSFGFAQYLRFLPAEGTLAFAKLRAALRGRYDALIALRTTRESSLSQTDLGKPTVTR